MTLAAELSRLAVRLAAVRVTRGMTKRIQRDADVLILTTVEAAGLVPEVDPTPLLKSARHALNRLAASVRADSSNLDTPTLAALVSLFDAAARVSPEWAVERAELRAIAASVQPPRNATRPLGRDQLLAHAKETIQREMAANPTDPATLDRVQDLYDLGAQINPDWRAAADKFRELRSRTEVSAG